MWALFKADGCKPVLAVLAQYFPHNYRVENQAGESGWVAIEPLRRLQRPEMPAAQGLFGFSISLFLGGLLPPVVQSNKGCKCK